MYRATMARNQHIYFLVHVSRERFKIGRATHPLKRWADLQPHAETDFAASLVFDLDSDVSAGWSERSLHRALRGSRADMPPDRDGHTEWFEYSAFGKARAIARIFRDHLGIGEGYALAAPSVRDAERTTSEGLTARGTRSGTSLEAAALHNDEVATAVESHVSALISSGSILGRARVGERKHLYFDRARISPAEVMLQLDTLIYGPSWSRVFGGARANDRFVRLAIESPFHEPKELDECETARLQNAYSTESRLETTPGFERVRSAILRLIDAAPRLPLGHEAVSALG